MRNRCIPAMRELIRVTPEQEEELRHLAGGNGGRWHYIQRVLLLRATVLREFDKMAEKSARTHAS